MNSMKREIAKLLEPVIEAASKVEGISDRMEFWRLVHNRAKEECTNILMTAAKSMPSKMDEARRQIDIICSPYKGHAMPADTRQRVKEDAEAVLYNLGITGKIVVGETGIVIISATSLDDAGDHEFDGGDDWRATFHSMSDLTAHTARTGADIDFIANDLPQGATKDFLIAVNDMVSTLIRLDMPDRQTELKFLTKYLKLRRGAVESKYDLDDTED